MPPQKSGTSRRKDQGVDLDKIGLEIGNKPPQALDVEEAVLGAMLLEPECVDQALEELEVSRPNAWIWPWRNSLHLASMIRSTG